MSGDGDRDSWTPEAIGAIKAEWVRRHLALAAYFGGVAINIYDMSDVDILAAIALGMDAILSGVEATVWSVVEGCDDKQMLDLLKQAGPLPWRDDYRPHR